MLIYMAFKLIILIEFNSNMLINMAFIIEAAVLSKKIYNAYFAFLFKMENVFSIFHKEIFSDFVI